MAFGTQTLKQVNLVHTLILPNGNRHYGNGFVIYSNMTVSFLI